MSGKKSEMLEVVLGLLLGLPALFLGLRLIAGTCNLVFPTPPTSPGCYDSASNLFGIVGLILAPIGAIAVIASLAVLIGRRKR